MLCVYHFEVLPACVTNDHVLNRCCRKNVFVESELCLLTKRAQVV